MSAVWSRNAAYSLVRSDRLVYFADQICFAGANFVLTSSIARVFSPLEFSAYSLGLLLALFVGSIFSSLYITSFMILPPEEGRRMAPIVTGQHLIAMLFALAFITAAGTILYSYHAVEGVGEGALACVACSCVFIQADYDRVIQIKFARKYYQFCCSAAYLAVVVVMAALAYLGRARFIDILIAMMAYAVVKSYMVYAGAFKINLPAGLAKLASDLRNRGPWALAVSMTYASFAYLPFFILSGTAPATEVGGLNASRSLTQPLQILARSLDLVDKNILISATDEERSVRAKFWTTFATYGLITVLGYLALVVVGDRALALAYGTRYAGYGQVVLWFTFVTGLMALVYPIESIVFLHAKFKGYLFLRAASAIVAAATAVWLCPVWGASGAAIAICSGWLTTVVGGLILIRNYIF